MHKLVDEELRLIRGSNMVPKGSCSCACQEAESEGQEGATKTDRAASWAGTYYDIQGMLS